MVRTLLVTGATGGIGAAVVRAAADRGYDVLAAGRDSAALDWRTPRSKGDSGVTFSALRGHTPTPICTAARISRTHKHLRISAVEELSRVMQPDGICGACYWTWLAAKPQPPGVYCHHQSTVARRTDSGWVIERASGREALAQLRREGIR